MDGTRKPPWHPISAIPQPSKAATAVQHVLALLTIVAALFAGGVAPAHASDASTPDTAAATKPAPSPPAGVAVGRSDTPKPHASTHGLASPRAAWSVSLSADRTLLWPTQYATLTATANSDVGPSPYFMYIFDLDSGTVVAECGSGTTCAVALTQPTAAEHNYYAYIANYAGYPPQQEQAESQQLLVDWQGTALTLSADKTTLAVGDTSTLTATTATDIGPSPFYTQIFDTTTGARLASCGYGSACAVAVTQTMTTTHTYVAVLAYSGSTYPPSAVQNTSPTSYIAWTGSGLQISLSAPDITYNSPETVTATASIDVGPTPYYIEIFDESGTLLHTCGTTSTCSFSYSPSQSGNNLVAFICSASTTLPPADIQASSNTVTTRTVFIG